VPNQPGSEDEDENRHILTKQLISIEDGAQVYAHLLDDKT
jgi:hypothetical protein